MPTKGFISFALAQFKLEGKQTAQLTQGALQSTCGLPHQGPQDRSPMTPPLQGREPQQEGSNFHQNLVRGG